MPKTRNSRPSVLLLLLLLTLASGCATNSPLRAPDAVPLIPPLSAAARQPPPPKICTPTCSDGLTRLRTELLDTLAKPQPQAAPASAATTR